MNNIFISFLSQARSLGIILRPPPYPSSASETYESYTAGLEKTCILNSYTCNIAATIQVQTTITSSLVSFRFPPPPIPCFLAILQSTCLPRPSCDFPGTYNEIKLCQVQALHYLWLASSNFISVSLTLAFSHSGSGSLKAPSSSHLKAFAYATRSAYAQFNVIS